MPGRDVGFAGPDLSTVASRRSVDYLRSSIGDPDEDVNGDGAVNVLDLVDVLLCFGDGSLCLFRFV